MFEVCRDNSFARNDVRSSKTGKLRFYNLGGNPFARNEVRSPKIGAKIAILQPRRQLFRTKWGSIAKNCGKIATLKYAATTLSHETMRFFSISRNPFTRNEVRSLWITDGRANPLIDRKVVGVVFAGKVAMVAVVTSPTTAGCSVMYCNCSCSCSVVEL